MILKKNIKTKLLKNNEEKRHLSERRNNKCRLFFGSPHQSFLRINTEKKRRYSKKKRKDEGGRKTRERDKKTIPNIKY
jgi:hypothetical protein